MKTVIERELCNQGTTIYRLCQLIGFNRTNTYGVVRGYSRATLPMRTKIADALGVAVDDLFDSQGVALKI
ncbi:hypothetical protein SDC9_58259 [bioreactor metagenome]|uniref:HTH cro/C1-type domain-containing protein n=1 Tax=bioreactor metagenome TaxID=1076179 RepID=A0A644X7X2_9ZZZZ